jgi:DNA-binding transcriptional MerR regulator
MVDKSPDAFRTISEAAEELDVPQHVLRFWETRFAQVKPMKRGGGRRYYRPADVELLKGIRSLLYKDGYTIRGVQKILKEDGAAYVAGVGRGDIEPRKREDEMATAPPPGTAKAAPRVAKSGAGSNAEPEAEAPAEAHTQTQVQPALLLGEPAAEGEAANRLPETQADMLRAALRELNEARRILDPTLPP